MFSSVFKHYAVIFLPATVVWLVWLTALGITQAFEVVFTHWQISLTMIFGSLVAGATSMGGGVVAFPVFTKVLAIPAYDAKVFSLAIQSVGMGAATLVIYLRKIQVDWQVIRWGTLGGAMGIFFGLGPLTHILPPPMLKLSFTLMLSSFAIALFLLNRKPRSPHPIMPRWGKRERVIVLVTGLFGGIFGGMVGTGIDIFVFVVMVLLFRVCEKTATPTSVVLMAFNAMCGFAIQVWLIQDFSSTVQAYWLAAVPIVVVGAPLGAILCSYLTRYSISYILISLIAVELLTTLWLIPLTPQLLYTAMGVFLVFSYLNYRMFQNRYYEFINSNREIAPQGDTEL